LLERYGLGRTMDDRWQSQSLAKSVVSILVGAAIQDGYIKSVDSPVSDYIPELKTGAFSQVTIRQLLMMTSGAESNDDYIDPNSGVFKKPATPFEEGEDPTISYARKLARAYSPGSQFQYKAIDPVLASLLVARATGRPVSEYLSEKIWQPLGMEKDAFWRVN